MKKTSLILVFGLQFPAYIVAGILIGWGIEQKIPAKGLILTFSILLSLVIWLVQLSSWQRKQKAQEQGGEDQSPSGDQ